MLVWVYVDVCNTVLVLMLCQMSATCDATNEMVLKFVRVLCSLVLRWCCVVGIVVNHVVVCLCLVLHYVDFTPIGRCVR